MRLPPKTLGADKGYHASDFVDALRGMKAKVKYHIPLRGIKLTEGTPQGLEGFEGTA
jgi:hypothetical protein